MCPNCKNPQARIQKKGFFVKQATRAERIQRYRCCDCRISFSDQTNKLTYYEKKPHLNQILYRTLASGVSQSRCAVVIGVTRVTVARKLMRLAHFARHEHERDLLARGWSDEIQFDEMETFEHSKCKPVSIALAVDREDRFMIAARLARMPAKGRLARISRAKYGPRPDGRPVAMHYMMERIKRAYPRQPLFHSDKKWTYPKLVRSYYPQAVHRVTKGRRGCVVGQGELKAGGWDPIFTLNHTAAMVRDNLKTMSRRTWCTVKRLDRLQDLLDLYVHFHNRFVVQKTWAPSIWGGPIM